MVFSVEGREETAKANFVDILSPEYANLDDSAKSESLVWSLFYHPDGVYRYVELL